MTARTTTRADTRRRFRVAILGAGGIAPEHMAVLRWMPEIEVVAVCDLSAERAKEFAGAHKIPAAFAAVAEMLERARPDVVHVLLPPGEHVRLASECVNAGSHVFVEKPLGITSAECRGLARVAEASSRLVGVNHNMVYRPVVQRLLDEARGRRFGGIVHVNIAWSFPPSKVQDASPNKFFLQEPKNVLLEWAVHPLSVVVRLLGKVQRASLLVGQERRTSGGRSFLSSWQASLECERGTAQLAISAGNGFDCCWMDVLGEDALAHVDLLHDAMSLREYSPYRPAVAEFRDAFANAGRLFATAGRDARDYVLNGLGWRRPGSPGDAAMAASIRAFYRALASGDAPPQGISQGTAVVEACERIFESASPDARARAM